MVFNKKGPNVHETIWTIYIQDKGSLRKHPFLLPLRRWGRNVPSGEERMFSQAKIKGTTVNRSNMQIGARHQNKIQGKQFSFEEFC